MSGKKGQQAAGTKPTGATGSQYNNLMLELHTNPYKFQYKSFGASKEIIVHQNFDFGIGGVLWDCGLILARYACLPENHTRWLGKVVVELGAGTGLPAMVCWQLGAKAIATDLAEVVEPITGPNVLANIATANKLQRKQCQAAVVSWGSDSDADQLLAHPLVKENNGVIDMLIAADVVYRGEDHPKLLHTIQRLASDKTVIIFVHRSRVSNDGNFVEPLKASFVQTKATSAKIVLPTYPKDNATVYEFCGRRDPSEVTANDEEEHAEEPAEEEAA